MLTYNPENHEYRYGGVVVESVSQICRLLYDSVNFDEAAALRGTEIHAAIADWLRGKGDADYFRSPHGYQIGTVDAFITKYNSYQACIERPVYCETHRIAGTPDAIGFECDDPYVYEWKTGQKYAWHHLQAVAYMKITKSVGYRILYVDYGQEVNQLTDLDIEKTWNDFLTALNFQRIKSGNRPWK